MLEFRCSPWSCNSLNATVQMQQKSIKIQLCHTMHDEECLQSKNTVMKARVPCLPKQHSGAVKTGVPGDLPISSLSSCTQNPWFLAPNNKVNSKQPLKQGASCNPKVFPRMTRNQHPCSMLFAPTELVDLVLGQELKFWNRKCVKILNSLTTLIDVSSDGADMWLKWLSMSILLQDTDQDTMDHDPD